MHEGALIEKGTGCITDPRGISAIRVQDHASTNNDQSRDVWNWRGDVLSTHLREDEGLDDSYYCRRRQVPVFCRYGDGAAFGDDRGDASIGYRRDRGVRTPEFDLLRWKCVPVRIEKVNLQR